jgi:hypothetical protein
MWKEALETACTLLNLGPSTGRPLSPSKSFLGVKPDVTLLRTWGCLAYCHVPEAQRGVFAPKAIPGMFTGYSPSTKAYRLYFGGGVWRESRDVFFVENIRWAARVGVGPAENQQTTFQHLQAEDASPSTQVSVESTIPERADFSEEEMESAETKVSVSHPSNSPDSALPEPLKLAETEPLPSRKTDPGKIPTGSIEGVLEHIRSLARGNCEPQQHLHQLDRAQRSLRPAEDHEKIRADVPSAELTREQR